MDLLDVRSDARLVRRALDEGGRDARALDALLDVADEDLGELVLRADRERLRQVVVGVDTGREDDVQAALVGHTPAEGRVPLEEHRARLDDRLYAVTSDRVRVRDSGLPLDRLVIQIRELEAGRLVGGAEVLVDEREPELLQADG